MSTPKTKYEKKDTPETKASFSRDEISSLLAVGSYAAFRRARYMEAVASKPLNPKLDDLGAEYLSEISMVADVDMAPLSTRQQLARFVRPVHLVNGDGFDSDDDSSIDADFFTPDRADNPPSPHEIRAQKLDRKLTRARAEHSRDLENRRIAAEKGSTDPEKKSGSKEPEAAKAAPDPSIPRE